MSLNVGGVVRVLQIKCSVEEYEKPKAVCPKCKSGNTRRKISSFSVQTESKT